MRMSCNGCRVLRKGCSEKCSIRPCLQWIKSPESQANATVFLAKFYGRAGLVNLINAGPEHLRPAIFRSLLYEACGRMVNPIYGSVGLLWSGKWKECQSAVEAVLKGDAIKPISQDIAVVVEGKKGWDIRHISKDKDDNSSSSSSVESKRLIKPTRTTKFKRQTNKPIHHQIIQASEMLMMTSPEFNLSSTSHDSSVSHLDETTTDASIVSLETPHAHDIHGKPTDANGDGDGELELELTLGFGFGFGSGYETAQKGHTASHHSIQTSIPSAHDLRLV